MKTDIEIARETVIQPISDIIHKLGLKEEEWESYGKYKAKLDLAVYEQRSHYPNGKLILVTSINPTPAGEGKTTVTIGLGQALNRIGKKAIIALREPSMGPNFGMKGGATGGGYAQVVPMEDINLHFTGDFHAIGAAHNLLAALIDNHIHQGNKLGIDPRNIIWKRVLDINDRSLRHTIIGLGGRTNGIPRETGFDITVASELMAILCLVKNLGELKESISRIVVGYTYDNQPVYVKDLHAEAALTIVLKDAIKPNLAQTLEHTPVLIHGGPFANIAHGCNSLIATRMALKLGDYVVTEAGFGADLGAEKFFHIKCRKGEIQPDAAVIVATIRALKLNGGAAKDQLPEENLSALEKGLGNLEQHADIVRQFGVPYVIALNRFPSDTEAEIDRLKNWCQQRNIPVALTEVWEHGGEGGEELARKVIQAMEKKTKQFHYLYDTNSSIPEKITEIVTKVYGGIGVHFTDEAKKQIEFLRKNGWDQLPICMAKTPYSFSDNPSLRGKPEGFTISVKGLRPSLGAGFIVAYTGDIMTMPGLPKDPAALNMDIDDQGCITGLS